MTKVPVDDASCATAAMGVELFLSRLWHTIAHSSLAKRGEKGKLEPAMRTAAEIAGVIAALLFVLPVAVDLLIAVLVAAGLASLGDRRTARRVLKQAFVNLFRRMRGLEPVD